MKARILLLVFWAVVLILDVAAFEFSVSPNDKGSADVFAQMEWNYSPLIYSGFKAENRSTFEETNDLDRYIATSGDILSLSLDVLGYRFSNPTLSVKAGLNFTYEKMNLKELGYIDVSNDDLTTRFFILNNRIIDLYLPRLTSELDFSYPFLSFSARGEYSPWLYVKLQQELTISPGLDTTSQISEQNTNNAWSVDGTLRLRIPLIEPRVSLSYTNLSIAYDSLTAAGLQYVESDIQILTIRAVIIPRFINLQGFFPTFGISYEINQSTTLIGGQVFDGDQRNLKYRFGFSR